VAATSDGGTEAAVRAGVDGYRLRVAASALGLVSAALPVPPDADELLGLAPGQTAVALLALGHPASEG
jgi:hypothetical protein